MTGVTVVSRMEGAIITGTELSRLGCPGFQFLGYGQ